MDLRKFKPSDDQVKEAIRLLRYQPFIIDDDHHTGIAYSWLHLPDPTRIKREDACFDRNVISGAVWDHALDANRRLANMYEAFLQEIVSIAKAGTYLDVGCNTGYFPVHAALSGVRYSVGIDIGDYSHAFELLKNITGSAAQFHIGGYDPRTRSIELPGCLAGERFDVVSSTALLCHLSQPLQFLDALAKLAKKAVFVWSGFIDSDELLIRYNKPNRFGDAEFPDCFDDGTSISLGLLFLAMDKLGFSQRKEIKPQPGWLPANWHERGIPHYQPFRAFLFHR